MGFINCVCPPAAAMASIPNTDCLKNLEATNRFAVQRLAAQPYFNTVGVSEAITDEARWDAALAAADDTKIQLTPLLVINDWPSSTPTKFGADGGNDTEDGTEIVINETRPLITGEFQRRTFTDGLWESLRSLFCESIVLFPIGENGSVIYRDGALATDQIGLEVIPGTFYIGSPSKGQRTDPDRIPFEFKLRPTWADGLKESATPFLLGKTNP